MFLIEGTSGRICLEIGTIERDRGGGENAGADFSKNEPDIFLKRVFRHLLSKLEWLPSMTRAGAAWENPFDLSCACGQPLICLVSFLSPTFLWCVVFLIFIRPEAHVSLRVICMCGFQYEIKDTMNVLTSLSRVLLWASCKVNISQHLGGFLECQGPARRKGVAAGCGPRFLIMDKGRGSAGCLRFLRERHGILAGRDRVLMAGAGGRGTGGKDRGQRTAPGKPVARLKAETP